VIADGGRADARRNHGETPHTQRLTIEQLIA
jgi:hypothetical protein